MAAVGAPNPESWLPDSDPASEELPDLLPADRVRHNPTKKAGHGQIHTPTGLQLAPLHLRPAVLVPDRS